MPKYTQFYKSPPFKLEVVSKDLTVETIDKRGITRSMVNMYQQCFKDALIYPDATVKIVITQKERGN